MKTLTIVIAALAATLSSTANSQQYSGIWIIENYYGSVAVAGAEVGRKVFYCDGRVEVEGQITDNAYLEYVNGC